MIGHYFICFGLVEDGCFEEMERFRDALYHVLGMSNGEEVLG